MARFTLNIHTEDSTKMDATRIPSGGTDFVSVGIGSASVFLFNTAQAKALGEAVAEAYNLLRQIELEKVNIAPEFPQPWTTARDDSYIRCTIENPCDDCLEINSRQYEPDDYYPDWDDRF